jgi:hypothetical protein
MEEVYRILPDLKGKLSPDARLIASEPTGRTQAVWAEVPQSSYLRVEGGEMIIKPFRPMPPRSGAGVTAA